MRPPYTAARTEGAGTEPNTGTFVWLSDHGVIVIALFPYVGASNEPALTPVLGTAKPFAHGVGVWLKELDNGDWLVAYQAHGVLLFNVFSFSGADVPALIGRDFADTDGFFFEGRSLNELLTRGWSAL